MPAHSAAKNRARTGLILLGGVAMGARAMYMLDPDRGRRRRAQARGRVLGTLHRAGWAVRGSLRDLIARLRGIAHESMTVFPDPLADDKVILGRVRSRLGRVTSHAGAITVTVEDAAVRLEGPILEAELKPVLRAVKGTRGVRSVENLLTVHAEAGTVPGLQGRSRRAAVILDERRRPALRLLTGAAGLLLGAWGVRKRGIKGLGGGIAGAALLLRSLAHGVVVPEVEDREGAIHLQKTLRIEAPLEKVYAWLAEPEQFPAIMSHVHDVKKLEDGHYRWTLRGPLGVRVVWESEIVEVIPNRLLRWRSVPGAGVRNDGIVLCEANEDGSTRMHVRFSYQPPGGLLGHVLADVLGEDPKGVMDDDLLRLKSLLERGKTRAHGKVVCIRDYKGPQVPPEQSKDFDLSPGDAAVNGDLAP